MLLNMQTSVPSTENSKAFHFQPYKNANKFIFLVYIPLHYPWSKEQDQIHITYNNSIPVPSHHQFIILFFHLLPVVVFAEKSQHHSDARGGQGQGELHHDGLGGSGPGVAHLPPHCTAVFRGPGSDVRARRRPQGVGRTAR